MEQWQQQKDAQDRNAQQLKMQMQTPAGAQSITAQPEVSGQWQRPAASVPAQAVRAQQNTAYRP